MKLDLIDKKPPRDDYWFAAYSVTLRMPVLIYPDGGGLDKFYSIYRLSDEEFKKYDTEEFDAVVEDVRNNLESRYLGRNSSLALDTIELADGVVLSGIKSSYPAYDETPRRLLHKDRFLYSPNDSTKETFKNSQRTQSSYPKKRDISLLVLVLLIIIGIVFLLLVGLGDIWGDKKTNSGIDDYTYPESGIFLEGITPTSESTSSSN